MVDLKAGIVRILDQNSATVGTGFVVTDGGLIVTCAHVAEAAGAGPGGAVRVVFHTTGEEQQAEVTLAWWRAPGVEDVAVLRLEGSLPKGVVPLPLGSYTGIEGHAFSTFGFPDAKPVEGLAGKCEVIGRTTNAGFPVLQLRSSEVTRGFSGAPVWDQVNYQVIGMVTAITRPDALSRLQETAFIIPTETLRQVCPNLHISIRRADWEPVPLFCAPADFSARLERGSPFKYALPLVGRTNDLAALEAKLAQSDVEVLVIHGPPGVGKTKLALELAQRLQDLSAFASCDIAFVRETAESVENHWHELGPGRRLILFIDDAHHVPHLSQLKELRMNRQLTAGTRFVLLTNSLQKQAVVRELDIYTGVHEHEVTSLTLREIDMMLASPPFEVKDEDTRRNLARISGGNPLFAQIGLQVVSGGGSLREVPRNELLARYVDARLHDIEQAQTGSKHRAYLSLLAGLRSIERSNEPLRERIKEVLSLTDEEEEALVADLRSTGLVTQTWSSIRITPDLLSVRLLISDYFESSTKRYDFQKRIVSPFLRWKAEAIVSNLVDAESTGVLGEPGMLLDGWIAELETMIETGNSAEKCSVLETLVPITYQRPDDVLCIVDAILEGPESEDVVVPGLFQDRVVGQPDILERVVMILEKTCRLRLDSSLEYLFELSTCSGSDERFATIRQSARDAIARTVTIEPKKPFAIYETALDRVSNWLKAESPGASEIAVLVLRGVYRMRFFVAEASPLNADLIETRQGAFHPHQSFRRIRDRVIALLKEAYNKADAIATQVELVDILDGAIVEFHQGNSQLRSFLAEEFEPAAQWLAMLVNNNPPLPVRAAIWNWAHRVRHFGQHDSQTVRGLVGLLADDRQFELYGALVGVDHWDLESGYVALKEHEANRRKYIRSFLDDLTIEAVEQTATELERIAEESRQVGREGSWNINMLMFQIGYEKPNCAIAMIGIIETRVGALKKYLGYLLSGMASASAEAVERYVVAWRNAKDRELQAVAVHALWHLEGELFNSTVDVVIDLQDDEHDQQLVTLLTSRAAERGHMESVARLKTIAARASEATLNTLARALCDEMRHRESTSFKLSPGDFLDLVENLKRLQGTGLDNFYVDTCLMQAVYLAPDRVLDWLKERIERELELRVSDKPSSLYFRAIPWTSARFLGVYQKTTYYPTAVRRVRDWCLRDQIAYRHYGKQALRAMCPGIGPVLRQALLEWIQDGREEKVTSAISILSTFNEGPQAPEIFYELLELILFSKPTGQIRQELARAIRPHGAMSSAVYQDRLNRMKRWLSHENSRVRRFAQRQVAKFEQLVATECQLEENLKR